MSAEYIDIKQYDDMNVTARDDRILYDTAHSNGIVHGCAITYVGGNTIHITAGYGIVKGALFEIQDHDETIPLTESGTKLGQLYVHFDLSSEHPITIETEVATSLSPMEQNEDANFINGVYDIQLCTFTVGTTVISDLAATYPLVIGATDFAMDFVSKRTHFNTDGSIRITYDSGRYVIQDFPDGYITRMRLYDANGTLRATKTTTSDALTGDVVETVVKN